MLGGQVKNASKQSVTKYRICVNLPVTGTTPTTATLGDLLECSEAVLSPVRFHKRTVCTPHDSVYASMRNVRNDIVQPHTYRTHGGANTATQSLGIFAWACRVVCGCFADRVFVLLCWLQVTGSDGTEFIVRDAECMSLGTYVNAGQVCRVPCATTTTHLHSHSHSYTHTHTRTYRKACHLVVCPSLPPSLATATACSYRMIRIRSYGVWCSFCVQAVCCVELSARDEILFWQFSILNTLPRDNTSLSTCMCTVAHAGTVTSWQRLGSALLATQKKRR